MTKELAIIELHILASKYRKEHQFQLNQDYFTYQGDSLPEDDGSNVRYTTTYAVVDVMVSD